MAMWRVWNRHHVASFYIKERVVDNLPGGGVRVKVAKQLLRKSPRLARGTLLRTHQQLPGPLYWQQPIQSAPSVVALSDKKQINLGPTQHESNLSGGSVSKKRGYAQLKNGRGRGKGGRGSARKLSEACHARVCENKRDRTSVSVDSM